VVGRPSWDQRFLRELMKRNPNIDLVSFYILRTTIDAPGVGERELSLIPFPVNQLFGSELDTFDVLVFQNFNHGPYSVGFYLGQIVDYVRGGGAFCMIGGDLSFGSGGYGDTPLEEILPVSLSRGDDYRLDEIRPVSTSTGQRHPVLDMGGRDVFGKLPPLGSYNRVSSVHPDADVLLAHPFERIDSRRAPLLALREVGRGRSAAVLTDGTWHWSFSGMEPPGNMRPYHRLWNNLLRWLIRDPALQPASLRSEKVRYSPEEPVSIALRVRNTPAGKVRLLLRRTTGGEVIERRLVDLDTKGFAQVEIASP